MKALCITLCMLCAGCGGSKDTATSTPESSTVAQAPPATPAKPEAAPSAASSAIATSDREQGPGRAELKELRQTAGGIVTLKMAIVNTGAGNLSFGGLTFSDPELGGKDYGSFGGIYLIDPVNKKKYMVLRDAENSCVCTRDFPSIAAGQRLNVWARFPAPPEDVTKVSVVIPTFLPMDDVPIAR